MKQNSDNMKRCKGCNAILQTKNNKELGYVKDLNYDLCLSCFNLKHYNISDNVVLKTHFPNIPTNSLIVYIVSSLHLNTIFKYDLNKFYPTQKIIVLINKIDLLPKTINFDLWVKKIKGESKKINILEVMPISALKGHYLDLFLQTLNHYNFKKAYFIGMQNSGKSTLLNRIALKQESAEVALTAHMPGLTKENITYKYNDIEIIDTPGIYEKGYISDYLTYDLYKNIMPNKPIKPITYQLKNNQSVIIGGLAIISVIKAKSVNLTFYLGNIYLHRTKYEKVYDLFAKHKNTLFKPTTKEIFEKRKIRLDGDEKYIINLFDLGYLITKGNITLEIYAPKNANILINKGSYHGL